MVFRPSDDTASLIRIILSLTWLNGPRNTSRNHCHTIRHAICRCQLKLYHTKKKPYVNMVQKRHRVLQSGKVFYGQTSSNLTFLLEITNGVSSGLKRRETFQRDISVQFKSQHLWWYGVDKCIRYGQLACFGRHYECWKVYKGFRATYAPLQMTSISGKALCISAGQCKTTYCSYYNSMAS